MQKLLKKSMVLAFWLFFFQLAAVTSLFILFMIEKSDLLFQILTGVLCASLFIDLCFVWIVLARISKSKLKNDVATVEIIGDDIQDVYSFAQIGLVLIDDKDDVIWVNDWFSDEQINIVDTNIFVWKEELRKLKNGEDLVKVQHNNRIYEVKFLKDANLFIFKDITEFNAITLFSKAHAPAIGIISIDNYQDIVALVDDVKANEMLSLIQKSIIGYAKKYNVFIKKYRADSYLMISNYEQYEKMLDDHFSILNEVREENVEEDYELTLSIGFALGIDDMVKLNDQATSALDVALSRGGDQVVISPYGENLIFIGGKTEAKVKRNRVKIRVLSRSIETLIKDSSNVLIMGHKDMDMDALGSALGLYFFVQECGKEVKIVYDEKLVEDKARKAFKKSFTGPEIKKMTISSKAALEEQKYTTLLILTDVHRPSITMNPKIVESAVKVAIVDHHRRGEEFVEKPAFSHIEPSASSASELVAELIRYNEKRMIIPPRIATMMLSGILLDTNYYRNKTGPRTYDASLILKEFGADNPTADSFLKEEFEEYALKMKIMATAKTPYFGIIVCQADDEDIIERSTLAICAQEALQIKGINACFVVGRIEQKKVGISARSDGSINVQLLMEKIGGGGHFASAATQFDNKSIKDVYEILLKTFDLYLNDARAS